MIVRNSLLGADVAEHVQLLLVFSAHVFFYQVVLWKQESFVVLRPLQIEFFRNLLENGDALSGTNRTLTVFGYNYHVQELVFVGWFYHLNPSLGINNWYSNFGTFRGFARPCPPGGTN